MLIPVSPSKAYSLHDLIHPGLILSSNVRELVMGAKVRRCPLCLNLKYCSSTTYMCGMLHGQDQPVESDSNEFGLYHDQDLLY